MANVDESRVDDRGRMRGLDLGRADRVGPNGAGKAGASLRLTAPEADTSSRGGRRGRGAGGGRVG